jgi:peptidoglycan DL-endopeptidase CwlO
VGAEAQEILFLSKQHLTAEVFAETIPHVQNRPTTKNQPARTRHPRRTANLLGVAACALAIPGLLAAGAIPAYGAMSPSAPSSSSSIASGTTSPLAPQSLSVSSTAVSNGGLARETVTVVTPRRHALIRWSPEALTATSRVVKIAKRYLGVRYKFGGESPAGFDCSGLVEFVYAQVGIHLPHSAIEQGRIGHRVSLAHAVPGDVVVMNGGAHVGIYIGDHEMIDAPEPGRRVSVDKIYDNDYYIVRF